MPEAARAQLRFYDRAVIQRARRDETARQLMSVPGVGAVVVLGYMTGVEDPMERMHAVPRAARRPSYLPACGGG